MLPLPHIHLAYSSSSSDIFLSTHLFPLHHLLPLYYQLSTRHHAEIKKSGQKYVSAVDRNNSKSFHRRITCILEILGINLHIFITSYNFVVKLPIRFKCVFIYTLRGCASWKGPAGGDQN
jgi:hypothetical protein